MTLKEYIEQVLKDYNLKHTVLDVERYLNNKARDQAVGNVAVIDDETVKEWIINFDPAAIEAEEKAKAQKHATEQVKVAVKNKEIKEKQEPKPEPKKEEVKKDEQISLFDLL